MKILFSVSLVAALTACAMEQQPDEALDHEQDVSTVSQASTVSYIGCPVVTLDNPELPFCATANIKRVTDRLSLATAELQFVPNYLTRGAAVFDLQTPQGAPPLAIQYRVTVQCVSGVSLDWGWTDLGDSPPDNFWQGGLGCSDGLGQSATIQLRYDRTQGRLISCPSTTMKGLCNSGNPW